MRDGVVVGIGLGDALNVNILGQSLQGFCVFGQIGVPFSRRQRTVERKNRRTSERVAAGNRIAAAAQIKAFRGLHKLVFLVVKLNLGPIEGLFCLQGIAQDRIAGDKVIEQVKADPFRRISGPYKGVVSAAVQAFDDVEGDIIDAFEGLNNLNGAGHSNGHQNIQQNIFVIQLRCNTHNCNMRLSQAVRQNAAVAKHSRRVFLGHATAVLSPPN